MSLMISTDELKQLLSSDTTGQDIIIFDCRFSLADFDLGRQQYEAGHIAGAQHLDMEQQLSGTKTRHSGRHPLPSIEEFTESMQQMGVNKSTLIIIYDDNRLAGAARLWWLLQYFGHQKIRILDGGFKFWCAQNRPLSQHTHSPNRGNFQAQVSTEQTVDYHWLNSHLKDENLQLIDSREAPRYQGIEEPIDPVAGHIPGAINYPWQGVTSNSGMVLPAASQQQRWRDLEGEQETIVYCGSGVTACVNLLALKLAGFDHAKLYPGSWSDWCSYPESPLASLPG